MAADRAIQRSPGARVGRQVVVRRGQDTSWAARTAAAWGSYPSGTDPRSNLQAVPGSSDYHLAPLDRQRLYLRSRALERANMWYAAALRNFSTILAGGDGPEPVWVGDGIEVAWQTEVGQRWWDDASSGRLDPQAGMPWGQWVALLAQTIARDGDLLAVPQDAGRCLVYETERVAKVILGRDGSAAEYEWEKLDNQGRSWMPGAGGGGKIGADKARLIALRDRFGQSRGAPALQSTLTQWDRLGSLVEAEIISAEAASLPWTVINTPAGTANLFGAPDPVVEGEAAATTDSLDGGWIPSDAGHMMAPPPGTQATPWAPGRPNLDVSAFSRDILRWLCAPLLPYEILFHDLRDLSYAHVRAMGHLANAQLHRWRAHVLGPLLDHLATSWLDSQPQLRRPNALLRIEWRWAKLDIRDREKDATSDKQELENGTKSLQDILGPDWQRVQDQRHAEALRQAGLSAALAAYAASLSARQTDAPRLAPAGAPAQDAPA